MLLLGSDQGCLPVAVIRVLPQWHMKPNFAQAVCFQSCALASCFFVSSSVACKLDIWRLTCCLILLETTCYLSCLGFGELLLLVGDVPAHHLGHLFELVAFIFLFLQRIRDQLRRLEHIGLTLTCWGRINIPHSRRPASLVSATWVLALSSSRSERSALISFSRAIFSLINSDFWRAPAPCRRSTSARAESRSC